MGQPVPMLGRRFGQLVVAKRAKNNKFNQRQWVCRCDCGRRKTVNGWYLRTGLTKSCGCFRPCERPE